MVMKRSRMMCSQSGRSLIGWRSVDRQRMNAVGDFLGKCSVDKPVGGDPVEAAENTGYDPNAKMCLTFRSGSGMPLVKVRFVHHIQNLRPQSFR